MTGCPAPEDLDALLGGGLSGDQADAVFAHVDECDACRIALGELADDAPVRDVDATVPERPSRPAPRKRGELPTQIDRYRIEKKLGAGGMGVVLLAEDTELRRKVVIKLLHPELTGDDTRGRQRLMREAQAMAKVSHPHVVPIFDVGVHDGQVFIAMEYLDGGDLAQWLETPRSLREIVDVFVAAGRGLAAAHREGLVHRDFKPHNVILGSRGEVKVSDFGLARPEKVSGEREIKAPVKPSLLDTPLTREGVAVGTPAYMAPEQIMAEDVDHRADQFSFCIALFQAVYGELPFKGKDTAEVLANTLDAQLPAPATDRKIPRQLRRVLERGLYSKAADRFPTMDALLAQLQPRRRWVIPAVAASTFVLVAAVVALVVMRHDKAEVCSGDAEEVAPVWNAHERARIENAFAALGDPAAKDAGQRAAIEIDHYVATWRSGHRDACLATRVRGDQNEDVMQERMRCLRRRRAELAALVDLLGHPDAELVANGPDAVTRLTSPRTCDNVETFDLSPQARAAQEAAEPLLAKAGALVATQKFGEAIALYQQAVAPAEKASATALLADIYYQLGTSHALGQHWKEANDELQRAVQYADEARDDRTRALALTQLISVAIALDKSSDAARWLDFARSAVKRAGDDGTLDASLELKAAELAKARKDIDGAAAAYQRAIEKYGTLRGTISRPVAVAHRDYGAFLVNTGRLAEGYAELEQAHAITIQTAGIQSVDVASTLLLMAIARQQQQRFDESITLDRAAITVYRKFFAPDDPRLALSYVTLALSLEGSGHPDEAKELAARVQAQMPRLEATDDQTSALSQLGTYYAKAQRYDDAYAAFERERELLVQAYETEAVESVYIATNAMAAIRRRQGRYEEASALLLQSRATLAKADPHGMFMADTLARLGVVERYRKNYAEAIKLGEQALAISAEAKTGDLYHGYYQLELARSLWDGGGDRVRALQLAHEGQDALLRAGDRATAGEAADWLAVHDRK